MIQVSNHAKERIRERIGCSDRKLMRLIEKAWNSKEPIARGDLNNASWFERVKPDSVKYAYRKLMGMIYVFTVKNDGRILLITVSKPSGSMGDGRKFIPTNENKKFRRQMGGKI